MKIFVALDSFKGSFSSQTALATLTACLPEGCVTGFAVADGGEGFLESLLGIAKANETPLQTVKVPVRLALGETAETDFLWEQKTRTAYLEVAQVVGLMQIPPAKRQPSRLTSFGVGQQIKAALDKGATEILIGLGGSGTVDGGVGLLQALGAVFYDQKCQVLPVLPMPLAAIERVDLANLDTRLRQVTLTFLADVENPLLGAAGAVAVFGPQKGLTPSELPLFEAAMTNYAEKIMQPAHWWWENPLAEGYQPVSATNRQTNFWATEKIPPRLSGAIGTGAAGGIGFALALLGGRYQSGVAFLIESGNLVKRMQDCDVVFTGEGSFDTQSLQGKLPLGICQAAKVAGKPVVLFCGQTSFTEKTIPDLNIIALCNINAGYPPLSLAEMLAAGRQRLASAAEKVYYNLLADDT